MEERRKVQTKFKRHQPVVLKRSPNAEYIEYSPEFEDSHPDIKKGMKGKINILLSNGQYHVEIIDEKGETIAYAPFNEEDLEED